MQHSLLTAPALLLQDLVIVGGLEMQSQAKALARKPHVVVATPGRLKVCTAVPAAYVNTRGTGCLCMKRVVTV